MFKIVLINIGFLLIAAAPFFLLQLASKLFGFQAFEVAIIAGIILSSLYFATVAYSLRNISDYGSFNFKDFFRGFKTAWPAGLVMGIFTTLLFLFIIPFYMNFTSIGGMILAIFVFWLTMFSLLSFQYYFAVYARLNQNIKKAVKKCIIISLDNSGFSLFLLLHNFIVFLLSLITFLIFPGPAGLLLYVDEALRIRLLKYDWLEANPGTDRKKIPWDAILIEEREKTGTRSFRNFIFPWKD
jgi:hypothetical protein